MSSHIDSTLARLEREAALHRRIQELLLRFSGGISSSLNLANALAPLVAETSALFGTRSASVWLYERRVRELVLAASSDPSQPPGLRVRADSGSPAARGLHLTHAEMSGAGDDRLLLAPLRGWRRALGTLVIVGDPSASDPPLLADGAYQLARQLSVAIENVQLLEEFLQQRRLLENTFNSLIDLVAVVNTGLQVVQMNGAFAQRVGQEAPTVLGRSVGDFIGDQMATWLAEAEEAGPGGAAATAGRTRQFTDDRLGGIFAVTVTPLINQDGVPVGRVLVARDVTLQVQLEAEREALGRRLAQSERLASLGQFVAGIAHEMNNPLQGVLGHLELLIRTSEAARPVRPTLRRVLREADRAAKIVRNLLVFTGSGRVKRVRLRMDRVLSRTLATRVLALKRGKVTLTRAASGPVASVEGDPLLLQQALLNVIVNAEHAVAAGSRPPRIDTRVQTSEDGRTVSVVIGDSGAGIPPTALPHLFDPFFTTKEVGKGTGLGLAITYGIIQEHGGTILAANRADGGAEFTITLPAVPPAEGTAGVEAAPRRRAAKTAATATRRRPAGNS